MLGLGRTVRGFDVCFKLFPLFIFNALCFTPRSVDDCLTSIFIVARSLSMARPLIVLYLIQLASQSLQECYNPDGTPTQDDEGPCPVSGDEPQFCCPINFSCQHDGLCQRVGDDSGYRGRYGCASNQGGCLNSDICTKGMTFVVNE